jgi:hypothetical protein
MQFGAEVGYDFGAGPVLIRPIGGDIRGSLVTGDGIAAVTLAVTGGMKF